MHHFINYILLFEICKEKKFAILNNYYKLKILILLSIYEIK